MESKLTVQDKLQLIKEIDHIFESGANELRIRDMIELFISKRFFNESDLIDLRKRCAENARTIKMGNSGSWFDASVDKKSILNTSLK